MDNELEKVLIHKVNTLETLLKVLLDELIDNDTVDFDVIMKRLDNIEKEQDEEREKMKQEMYSSMYYGPKGEA